uniref:Uncharacterized protein n=1 Tax=Rhizophora mucronata TaxID=61149 RepID=A0A2P2NIS0_RHIMU
MMNLSAKQINVLTTEAALDIAEK